jgi:hypothetical protein
MDRAECGGELLADIGTLLKDLKEMHTRAVTAASQRSEEGDDVQQQGGMVVKGRS